MSPARILRKKIQTKIGTLDLAAFSDQEKKKKNKEKRNGIEKMNKLAKALTKICVILMSAIVFAPSAYAQPQRNPNQHPDLSGNWFPLFDEDWQERVWGPHLVDYLGIPLNEEGQNRGISYDATTISMPERQCIFFVPHYVLTGPFGFAFWYDTDPRTGEITAWHHGAGLDMGEMTIWMDGREPPSELAPRNVGGTAYGEWIGNTLKAEFPYMQEGLMSRNGAPSSDQASLTLYFTVNENLLTVVGEIRDPVYLEEPYVLSRDFLRSDTIARQVGELCTPLVEVPRLDGTGDVPHYLPGQNPSLTEFSEARGIPLETVLGGAETLYPEYREFLDENYVRPLSCPDHCCTPTALQSEGPGGCKATF